MPFHDGALCTEPQGPRATIPRAIYACDHGLVVVAEVERSAARYHAPRPRRSRPRRRGTETEIQFGLRGPQHGWMELVAGARAVLAPAMGIWR